MFFMCIVGLAHLGIVWRQWKSVASPGVRSQRPSSSRRGGRQSRIRGLKTGYHAGNLVVVSDKLVGTGDNDGAHVAGADNAVEPHLAHVQD